MSKARRAVSSLGSVKAFVSGRACSDAMFHVINRAFDQPSKPEEPAAMPLAGGIMQHGYQCGLIWGAALGAGAQAYRLHGPGPQAEAVAIVATERIVKAFRELYDTIDCVDISGIDKSSTSWDMVVKFLIKGSRARPAWLSTEPTPPTHRGDLQTETAKIIPMRNPGVRGTAP